MKTFVVHYKKLVKRKVLMSEQLEKSGIAAEFVEHFGRKNLLEEDLYIFDRRKKYRFFGPSIPEVQMAITLSHLYAFKQLYENPDIGLVLEDDAQFGDDLVGKIALCLSQIPADWDMLFIGNGSGLHIPKLEIKADKLVYLKSREETNWGGNGATRCTDSYLLTSKCAFKLIEYSKRGDRRIRLPVDWWLNEAIRELSLNVYWAEPTFVTQGTQNGMYDTSY
jgi:GR25 family glycosyltransferase involved in LPS biosynthesis